ncbi:NARE ribosyltransferase, partial [Trogon melanurus]|nr:NARE ribosyltransferase [Trogon melanurus]
MELLVLGLVLLARNLVTGRPECPQDHTTIKEVPLDMAPNSFDDQYEGCSRAMEDELEELNHTEFANNSVYARTWTLATKEWQKRQNLIPQTLRSEQAIALLAYTLHCPLYKEFNAAVCQAWRSREEYLNHFNYKSLHFLLSETLWALMDTPQHCHQVFQGVRGTRFITQPGKLVRFGEFTSTTLWKEEALSYGQDTFFSVKTCRGVPIRDLSFNRSKEEILIPPFEIFQVTSIKQRRSTVFIELNHKAANSNCNCEFVNG